VVGGADTATCCGKDGSPTPLRSGSEWKNAAAAVLARRRTRG